MINNSLANKIKIIVDGPSYDEKKNVPKGSDLVTSGGCPLNTLENRKSRWQLPLSSWAFEGMATGLSAMMKGCKRVDVKKFYETIGGRIRLAMECLNEDGTLNDEELYSVRLWMSDIVKFMPSRKE